MDNLNDFKNQVIQIFSNRTHSGINDLLRYLTLQELQVFKALIKGA